MAVLQRWGESSRQSVIAGVAARSGGAHHWCWTGAGHFLETAETRAESKGQIHAEGDLLNKTSDYRGHPPAMWKDLLKVDLWKTTKRMASMQSDFKAFAKRVPVGTTVPDFTLQDTRGVKRTLADLRGQVVVLEFGAIT